MAAPMENVEIKREVPNKGKGLFVTRDIEEGTLLFEESPLVSCQFLWNSMYKYRACEFCMASLETAQEMAARLSGKPDLVLPHPECCIVSPDHHCRCDACEAEYCTAECRKSAWEKYHKTLCLRQSAEDPEHPLARLQDVWRNIHYPPETCSIMLIAKLVSSVSQSSHKDTILQQLSEFCKATEHEEEQIAHKLLGKQFQDQIELLRTLSTEALYNEEVQQWFTPEGFRSLIALIGTNGQGIGSSSLSVWVHNCDNLNLESGEREKLEHFIDQLYDDMEKVSGQFLNCEGSGLYMLQSSCNHSCAPNAEVTFPNNNHVLALKALQDIKQGEEVCISYLDDCELQRSRHSRQKSLRENYIFTCQCTKCIQQCDDPDVTSEEEEDSDTMDDTDQP